MRHPRLFAVALALCAAVLPASARDVVVGGEARFDQRVSGNVLGVGGDVSVDATIDGDAKLVGGNVTIGTGGKVSGKLTAVGGDISIKGPVGGSASIVGGDVTIDSAIDGDVKVRAGELRLGPQARIKGKLTYRGPGEIRQDESAQVDGGIDSRFRGGLPDDHGPGAFHVSPLGWLWTGGFLVLAALMAAAFPQATRRMGEGLQQQPGVTLLAGFIALVCVPTAALVLMVTIIGIPVALVVLMLYIALLFVGFAAAGVTLGDTLLARFRAQDAASLAWRAGAAAAAMLVLVLAVRVPYLGGFVALAILLAGMGAVVMLLRAPVAA